MARKPEDEIEAKLAELEIKLRQSDPQQQLSTTDKSRSLSKSNKKKDKADVAETGGGVSGDLYMLAGIALLGLGVFMVLQHTVVTTSWRVGMMGGGGFVMLPILIGIGIMFYDFKNKLGWILTGGGVGFLLFVLLSQLMLYFPSMTLLGFIFMFVPLCAGAAFVLKGLKFNKQLEAKDED